MKTWKKILIGSSLAGALVAGYNYVRNLNNAQNQLETLVSANIHKISLSGLIVRLDITLKNPSKGSFSIKYPFVKLIYQGSTIGSSLVVDKNIKLSAFGQAVISGIMVEIPVSGILSSAFSAIKDLLADKGVKVTVKTITAIDLGWKTFDFEKTDEIILKQAAPKQA